MKKNIWQGIGKAVWRHKYLWTIALFVAFIGFFDDNSFLARHRLKQENAALEAEIKQYEDQYNHDKEKLQRLKSDPQTLVRIAREDHQMKSADEDVYYVTYADSSSAD